MPSLIHGKPALQLEKVWLHFLVELRLDVPLTLLVFAPVHQADAVVDALSILFSFNLQLLLQEPTADLFSPFVEVFRGEIGCVFQVFDVDLLESELLVFFIQLRDK